MRAALYARVSTKDKGQDTANQLHQLRDFCAANGWTIVTEYIDHATGKHADRERFQAMFKAAARREFDFVVTWALDRLSREGVAKTFEHIKVLRSYGVEYISYTEPHFRTTGPAGELMIAVAAWIAEQERKRISERTKAGLAKARRQGKALGRKPLVVYRDKIAELDADGLTMREIAEEMGISAAAVCRILKAHRRPRHTAGRCRCRKSPATKNETIMDKSFILNRVDALIPAITAKENQS
jgi:DNA invertase Pin-like site-specific DNA recombinase